MSVIAPDRVRLRRIGLALWCAVGAISLAQLGTIIGKRYQLALNETDSLPHWAFFVDRSKLAPRRGDYYAFLAPANPYYPANFRFTKRIAGVPGDVVSIRERTFYINGLPVGEAKPADRSGQPVDMAAPGRIPAGRYFVITPSPDSLDSRYRMIGLIPAERLVGRAYPVM